MAIIAKEFWREKPKWNPEGYWQGSDGELTWDNRSHGAGVDHGDGAQDGHWDHGKSNKRWDRYGNPLKEQDSPIDSFSFPQIEWETVGAVVLTVVVIVGGVFILVVYGDPTQLQLALN